MSEKKDLLLPRVAAGDPDAVRLLMDRYGPLVWSIARKQVGAEAAEDVVQEVFIQLWKNAERYDSAVASEATFIATIARRRLIDHRRRVGRRPESEELPPEPGIEEELVDHVEIADEARLASDAISKLKPDQQRVLKLSLVEGLTHTQISEAIHLPLGTVKSHARRGLERVRALLDAAPLEEPGRSGP